MLEFELISGRKTEAGHVLLGVMAGGVELQWRFSDIRGAFVLEPIPYYCILGELKPEDADFNPAGRGIAYVLDECEDETVSFNAFISRMTDSATLLCADTLFTDLRKPEMGNLLFQYLDRNRLTQLSLMNAPFVESFRIGMSITRDWIDEGRLRIPKSSLIWKQLDGFSVKDLDKDSEARFWRLRALAFGVGAYQKLPPSKPLKLGRELSGGHGPGDWMAK